MIQRRRFIFLNCSLASHQSFTVFSHEFILFQVKSRLQIYKQNSEAIISAYSDVMIKVLGGNLVFFFFACLVIWSIVIMPSLVFVVCYYLFQTCTGWCKQAKRSGFRGDPDATISDTVEKNDKDWQVVTHLHKYNFVVPFLIAGSVFPSSRWAFPTLVILTFVMSCSALGHWESKFLQ